MKQSGDGKKPGKRKQYNVSVTFYGAAAAHAQQEAVGEGAGWRQCINAALKEISERPHIKRRQLGVIRLVASPLEGKGS